MAAPTPPTSITIATILLAVDDLEAGTGAIRVAIELAADTGAALIALSVLPNPEGYGLMGLDARAVEEDKARSIVERIAHDARAGGVNARAETTKGPSPAEAITDVALALHADVIVVGRRGRSDLARAMLGDVTARVIGAASCPVLVVPRAASYARKRILLATDGSPASERAARTASLCAKLVRLPVTVLSVEVPDHAAERQAEAARIVERTVADMRSHGIDASGKVRQGAPPAEIMAEAAEGGGDLIVIGSEGRSGLGRVMLGSNGQAVIGQSTCPVLVTTAKMPEAPPPRRKAEPKPAAAAPVAEAAKAVLARRTFLVVADDTAEMPTAVDFACRRARATDGTVAVLCVFPLLTGETPPARDGASDRAASPGLDRTVAHIQRMLGEAPKTFVRWGDPSQQLLALLQSEPGIDALVLAASADPRGPGPLIIDLVTRHAAALTVPLMIVPGQPNGRPA